MSEDEWADRAREISANLLPGERVRFAEQRNLWTVRAASSRFVVLTQSVPFRPAGDQQYTVIDVAAARRGSCNLIGWGYGDGTYDSAECGEMLMEFESGELELSHRNNIPVHILRVESPKVSR